MNMTINSWRSVAESLQSITRDFIEFPFAKVTSAVFIIYMLIKNYMPLYKDGSIVAYRLGVSFY